MYLPEGTLLGRYKITALIGDGGMGEVYSAEDVTLERRVALNVLPPTLAPDGSTVAAVSVATGEVRPLTSQRWFTVRQVEWLAGGDRLLFTAQEHSAGAPYQIWQLMPATGEARRVSNDLINYRMFSLTAGSDVMAAVSGEAESNTWVMPANDSARAKQITSGKSFYSQLSWTPTGGLFTAAAWAAASTYT